MKKYITLFYFLCVSLTAFAQSPGYGTQWVVPSQKYVKFKIVRDGMYRIYANTLSSIGWGLVNGNAFQLFNNGHEIAVYVSNKGTFANTDFIEFYAVHNSGWADSSLYAAPQYQPTTAFNLFTDTATYFLTYSPGQHLRIIDTANVMANHPTVESYCLYPQTQNYSARNYNYFWAGQPIIHSSNDYFSSRFDPGEGFYGGEYISAGSPGILSNRFNTPYAYPGGTFTITGQATGAFYQPSTHLMNISLNSKPIQSYSNTGYNSQIINCSAPGSWVTSPTSSVGVDNYGTPDAADDQYALSWLTLQYPRTYDMGNMSAVQLNLQTGTGTRYLNFFDFNTKNTTPILIDLTNNWRLTAVTLPDSNKFVLPASATGSQRMLYLAAQDSTDIVPVRKLTPVTFIDYSNIANQGDVIIVYNNALRYDSASGNADLIAQLASIKSSAGFTPVMVNIMQLYDQFGYGIYLSPISMRNFAQYAVSKWSKKIKGMILIGKGYEYDVIFDAQSNGNNYMYTHCFIPTFGSNTGPYYGNTSSGSDFLLTANNLSDVSAIPVGRISVRNYDELRKYIQKDKAHVAAQVIGAANAQTAENVLWQKNVLHLAGGSDYAEQIQFLGYLNNYKAIIQDTPVGAKVTTITKTVSTPVQIASAQLYDSLFDIGMSLVTFFGHSASTVLEFNIGDPNSYTNIGKYPFLLACGCYNGTLFSTDTTLISEQLVKAQNRAAIAMMGSANLTQSSSLNVFASDFYQAMSNEAYGKSLGEMLQAAMVRMQSSGANNDPNSQLVMEQMLLNGDPTIHLFPDTKPDYAIDSTFIRLIPTQINASLDSFNIMVIPQNLGRAIDTSIYLTITRTFPDGTDTVYTKLFKAPYYSDTVIATIKLKGSRDYGQNKFDIKINENVLRTIPEITYTNNEVITNIFINGDDILPIWPYNYSIVNGTLSPTLKGSTVNAFAPSESYIFEIDTTTTFSSPLKQTGTVTQTGGVVHWTPAKPLRDSTVYYWQCAVNKTSGAIKWHQSSFINLKASSPGWNQSHYYQFKNDDLTHNIILPDSSRKYYYINNVKSVLAKTGTSNLVGGNLDYNQLVYYINNYEEAYWNQGGNYYRMLIAVFDSSGFNPMINYPVGNSNGSTTPTGVPICHNEHQQTENAFFFDMTSTSDVGNINTLASFINGLPNGSYILGMTLNDANIQNWSKLSPTLITALHGLQLHAFDTVTKFHPYVFFCQKGKASYTPKEVLGGTTDTSTALLNVNVVKKWDAGYINSVTIGPASRWIYFHWRNHALEKPSTDIARVNIYGITNTGEYTTLFNNVTAADLSLNSIKAAKYPYLQLRLTATDSVHYTPAQLDMWRINYQPMPEAAINPNAYFSVSQDSIQLGNSFNLQVGVENVSNYNMDTIWMNSTFTNAKGSSLSILSPNKPLPALDTIHAKVHYTPTFSSPAGSNTLYLDVNPFGAHHRAEEFHFNNIAYFYKMFLQGDVTPPVMDVTFDGIHILSGDIVSAKPDVLILVKDENKYLPLNDTSKFKVAITNNATNAVTYYHFDNIHIRYTLPTATDALNNNNTARLELLPGDLPDGQYTLTVLASDVSNNPSGAGHNNFSVVFQVINKAMVTSMLNYPNPFTSSTRFIFTLTGTTVPDFIKIQVLTVSGKVVREINESELGPLHIGQNITQFAWNGTDQYGQRLANGVYLYRVVVNNNGINVAHYNSGADQWTTHGFGKMYLMR